MEQCVMQWNYVLSNQLSIYSVDSQSVTTDFAKWLSCIAINVISQAPQVSSL